MEFNTWLIEVEQTAEIAAKKARYKQIIDLIKPLSAKVGLTADEAKTFRELMAELEHIRFDLSKEPSLTDIPPNHERMSELNPEVVLAARQDLRRNKSIYLAISDAAAGAGFDEDTSVDTIMRNKNPSISALDFYNNFENTRKALHSQFGNTVKCYRSEGQQMTKPTKNWATTEEYARQFGGHVISRDIPIDNIIAVNVGLRGNYHELIVGQRPRI